MRRPWQVSCFCKRTNKKPVTQVSIILVYGRAIRIIFYAPRTPMVKGVTTLLFCHCSCRVWVPCSHLSRGRSWAISKSAVQQFSNSAQRRSDQRADYHGAPVAGCQLCLISTNLHKQDVGCRKPSHAPTTCTHPGMPLQA